MDIICLDCRKSSIVLNLLGVMLTQHGVLFELQWDTRNLSTWGMLLLGMKTAGRRITGVFIFLVYNSCMITLMIHVIIEHVEHKWLFQLRIFFAGNYYTMYVICGNIWNSDFTEFINVLLLVYGPGNYLKFYYAIKQAYPDMKIISNCDGSTRRLDHPADYYDYHVRFEV